MLRLFQVKQNGKSSNHHFTRKCVWQTNSSFQAGGSPGGKAVGRLPPQSLPGLISLLFSSATRLYHPRHFLCKGAAVRGYGAPGGGQERSAESEARHPILPPRGPGSRTARVSAHPKGRSQGNRLNHDAQYFIFTQSEMTFRLL